MSILDALLALFKRPSPDAPPDPPVTIPPPDPQPATPAAASPPAVLPASIPAAIPTAPPIPAPPGAAPAAIPAPVRPVIPDLIPAPRLNASLLSLAFGITSARATRWAYPIDEAMDRFGIATAKQRAAFLAQIGHESGRLVYVREVWGPTADQALYEPGSKKARDLGNTTKGDGYRFRGGGLLEITGRYNYRICGQRLGIDLENNPDLIEEPLTAALVSALFWSDHKCNQYADSGDFLTLSRVINLGNPNSKATPNGMSDRLLLWGLCKTAYGVYD